MMMSNPRFEQNAKAMLTTRLVPGAGFMSLYREFTIQLKRFLLTYKNSTTLGAVYDYAFGDAVDEDGNDVSTESMRPLRALPATYRLYYIRRNGYKFYEAPVGKPDEAALLAEWKRYLRLKDDDDACGAFLVRVVHLSSDMDMKAIMCGWDLHLSDGRGLLDKIGRSNGAHYLACS